MTLGGGGPGRLADLWDNSKKRAAPKIKMECTYAPYRGTKYTQ
jgi:hypothetical protein